MESTVKDYGLISVIIPVYNAEKYLRQCIDSVLSQTYINYEIILVDDGSKDNSLAICNQYKDSNENIKVFHKENGGASSARNVGIKEANGKYIYFLDSDDYIENNTLQKLVMCLIENSADLVFFEGRVVSENGICKGNYEYRNHYSSDKAHLVMKKMLRNKEFHVGTPFFFISKKIFDDNNLWFKEGVMYEDMLMSYQLFSFAVKAAHLHEKLYVRRYRNASVMTSKVTKFNFNSISSVYEAIVNFSDVIPIEKVQNLHIIRCAYNVFNVYSQMRLIDKWIYRKGYFRFKKELFRKKAFGDIALKHRCCGYITWLVYKTISKILGW